MAIMQRCCCFSNVRSGSTACGIYSLISSFITIATSSYKLAEYVIAVKNKDIPELGAGGMYAAYSINIAVAVFLLISSVVLLDGVSQNNGTKLIPYMVAITALMVLQTIGLIGLVVILAAAPAFAIVVFVVWLPFTALNITCLLCVISQYQELREGRGRISAVA